MADEKKVYAANEQERLEFLASSRARCRESESQAFETEALFKYNARTFWWAYLQHAQKVATSIMTFREFWDDETTYPRTIAESEAVSLAR